MLLQNQKELHKWKTDNGDNIYNLQYPLNSDSIVIDLGGYKGVWAKQIIDLYNPNVYIIEPVYDFYKYMVYKFSNNNKVNLLNVGVSTENKNDIIYVNSDASSFNYCGEPLNVELLTLENILKTWNLKYVDLIQINIEGDEYSLLEKIINENIINCFKYIQIQFHTGIENHIERRENICKNLINKGFASRFSYPFVWEAWENKNLNK